MTRVNVVLPDDLLKKLEQAAKMDGLSRSGVLQEASRMYIAHRRKHRSQEERRARMQEVAVGMDRLADKFGTWDGVVIVRRFREGRIGGST